MDLFLRYIPGVLLAPLLLLMVRNRAYKVCPAFFTYVAFGQAADIARFAVDSRPCAYYLTYWITEAGYCILGIAAMYEVFCAVLRARSWWTRLVFPGILALATVLSLAHASSVPPQVHGFTVYIVNSEIAIRFVQVIVFLIVGVLAALSGLRWYHLGVAAGFGLYSTVELLSTIKFSDFGMRFKFWWDALPIAAYSLAVLIWIWFFRVPLDEEPSPDFKRAVRYISLLRKHWSRTRGVRKADFSALPHLADSDSERP
jgi:hypothetical protein